MLMLCFSNAGWGQTSVGPVYPGAGANVDGPGTASWTNPGYITADDEDYATVELPDNTTTSELLQGTNYGFAIPAGATINGIEVKILRQSSYYNPEVGVYDVSLNLLKAGAITGDNYARSNIWTDAMTEVTYGGGSDLWGTSWSPDDINNSNFGISFSVTSDATGGRVAYVDYVTITVYYTPVSSPSFGPRYPGVGVNVDGPGTASWTNPGYITADDEDYATVELPDNTTTSELLQGTNYGFAIPTGATINGILVKIMRQSSDYNPDDIGIYDASLNLLKTGIIAGNNLAKEAIWSEDMTEVTYGGEYDLWGTTWTAEEINNTNFGVSFSVSQNGTGGRFAYVDYVTITVYYTPVPALSVNPASLDFGNVVSGGISTEQIFKLSGTNLTGYPGDITITAPSTDFQVSNDNTTWGATTTVAYTSATLAATDVYVRFTPQTTGPKSGNITFTGGGVTSPPTVALTGTGTVAPVLGDYRSVTIDGGNWSDPATWEYFDGKNWLPATIAPTSINNIITIRTSHTVYIDAPVTVDQVVVESGGQVILPSNVELKIANNEPGDDFVVYGTLSRTSGTITTTGTLVFGNGGTYNHAQDGGTIPSATWDTNSLCNITSVSFFAPTGLNPVGGFGNFTWNCSGQLANISLASDMTVRGNFTVSNTGNNGLYMSTSSTAYTINVAGNFIVVNPATFKMNSSTGSCTLSIGVDLNITGNIAGTTGFYLNSSSGTASEIVNVAGDVNVSSGCLRFSDDGGSGAVATLNLIGDFNHTGGYVQNTIAGGSYSGTINFAGTEMQTFNSTGITAGHIINLHVNSGAYLQMKAPETVVAGAGTFILPSGATLGITSPAGITKTGATGNIQVTGSRTFNAGANYLYNGSAAQNTGNGLPLTVNNLVFNNSGIITFDAARTITSNFSIATGSKANLGTFTHTTNALSLGGVGQASGSYGHSSSPATYPNDTYFDTATGIVNNSSPAGTWLGLTTDWFAASNWSGGVPNVTNASISSNVTNQPVISGTTTTASCATLIIGPGASLTIDPTGSATVTTLRNYGTLNLESNSTNIASLILNTYSNQSTGTNNIQLYLTGGGDENTYAWHYISSPVYSLPTTVFTGTTWDLAQFVESLPVSATPYSFQRGWIAWDTWSYFTEASSGSNGFSTLQLGKGYNYWHDAAYTYNISGTINTSSPSITLTYTGSDPIYSGYHLLGNPFTCGLDIQSLFDDGWPQSNLLKAIYCTRDNVSYVYTDGGVVVPGSTPESIPPMQGFFVRAIGTVSGTIDYLPGKTHSSTNRYKGDKPVISLVRLSIAENGKSEETVVRFDSLAKPDVDMNFDAPRMFSSSNNNPSIYSLVNGIEYTINGIPFPETSVEIPVVVKVLNDGNHNITAMELQELDNYKVTLTDKSTNSTVDLRSIKEYAFSASAGLIKDRFILTITNISTGTENPLSTENLFNIYEGFNLINIQPLANEWDGKTGSIKVMDFSGKTIRNQQKVEFRKNTLIQLPSPGTNGLYFIEIRSGIMKYVGKVVIR